MGKPKYPTIKLCKEVICKCDDPKIVYTAHPLPDICAYCGKAILKKPEKPEKEPSLFHDPKSKKIIKLILEHTKSF